MKQQWRKFNGEVIHHPIGYEVRNALMREKENGNEIKACIGTDSHVKGSITQFATMIVFTRKGKGDVMYIRNEVTRHKMSIKQRMLTQVAKSIDVAYLLSNIFTFYNVDMEIHPDVNTHTNFCWEEGMRQEAEGRKLEALGIRH